jgi:hypothetical protein
MILATHVYIEGKDSQNPLRWLYAVVAFFIWAITALLLFVGSRFLDDVKQFLWQHEHYSSVRIFQDYGGWLIAFASIAIPFALAYGLYLLAGARRALLKSFLYFLICAVALVAEFFLSIAILFGVGGAISDTSNGADSQLTPIFLGIFYFGGTFALALVATFLFRRNVLRRRNRSQML